MSIYYTGMNRLSDTERRKMAYHLRRLPYTGKVRQRVWQNLSMMGRETLRSRNRYGEIQEMAITGYDCSDFKWRKGTSR